MSLDKDGPAPQPGAFESIVLSMTQTEQDSSDSRFTTRTIRLTVAEPKIMIGRSSKTVSKGLLPAADNAFFDSPVMSRSHAEISADLDHGTLQIRDAGSLHGTSVNETPLSKDVGLPLKSGDTVSFGIHVARGLEVFYPTTVKIDAVPNAAAPVVEKTRAYSVPESGDEMSDGGSEYDCSITGHHSDIESDAGYDHDCFELEHYSHSSTGSHEESVHGQMPAPIKHDLLPKTSGVDEHDKPLPRSSSISFEVDPPSYDGKPCDSGEDNSDQDSDDQNAAEIDYASSDDAGSERPSRASLDYDSVYSNSDAEDSEDDVVSVSSEAVQDDGSIFLSAELNRLGVLTGQAISHVLLANEVTEATAPVAASALAHGLHTPPATVDKLSDPANKLSDPANKLSDPAKIPEDGSKIPIPAYHDDHHETTALFDIFAMSSNKVVPVTTTKKYNISSILNPSPPPSSSTKATSMNTPSSAAASMDFTEAAIAPKHPETPNKGVCNEDVSGFSPIWGTSDFSTINIGPCASNTPNQIASPSSIVYDATKNTGSEEVSSPTMPVLKKVPFMGRKLKSPYSPEYPIVPSNSSLIDSGMLFLNSPGKETVVPTDDTEMEDDDNDAMASAAVFQCHKEKEANKKRKAEEMLESADDDTAGASNSATHELDSPAPKRPATEAAVHARKKVKSTMWAVAEKVGIAALGGAVVLGSLIYTAPTF